MLVYDAGTFSLNGTYAGGRSRLSDLAGVDYALYDKLGDKTIQWSKVTSSNAMVSQMEIPPGKYYPFHAETSASVKKGGPPITPAGDFEVELRRYKYGELQYPSFVTSGNYAARFYFTPATDSWPVNSPFKKVPSCS